MAIKQSEIPGTERPRIGKLDDTIADWLNAQATAKTATKDVKAALSAATEAIREVAEQLDTDDHENPCYVFRDGDREIAVKLSSSSKLVSEVLVEGTDPTDNDNNGDGDPIG